MEVLVWVVLAVAAVGVIAIGLVGSAVAIMLWWVAIPALGALVGGWFGFFFGLGLVVIIFIVWAGLKG